MDSSGAVFLFIVYGVLVADGILYFNENNDLTMADKRCQISCLEENVYLLLSIFPVYMGHFIKEKKRKTAAATRDLKEKQDKCVYQIERLEINPTSIY